MSIQQRFEEVDPDLSDRAAFQIAAAERFNAEPALIDAWQNYSWDMRSSPSPYMDGLEVGFFDDGRRDVYVHLDATAACADYLFREALWVLQGGRAGVEPRNV